MLDPDTAALAEARIPFRRELIAKYDRPGPRYTSYPTAPQFHTGFDAVDYATLLDESRAKPLPLSLYVHIPFCEQRCFFCGCNVAVTRNRDRAERYLERLRQEIEEVSLLAGGPERQTIQVHWGGGTPTYLDPRQIVDLMSWLRFTFPFAKDCEISVEVDPRHASEEQLDALAEAGVNRLSMGIQDFDPEVQVAVNREQPVELAWKVMAGARRRGIGSINVDLIYGLPHQTPTSFRATLEEVVRLSPDRLAVFNFAYLPSLFKHQRAIPAEALPSPETKLNLLEETLDVLTGAGYQLIGMDHFAKPEDPLARALVDGTLTRNFQGYTTAGETDLLAFGTSSISKVADGYAQNDKDISAWDARIEIGELATCRGLLLSQEDLLRREVILGVLCHFGLDKQALAERWSLDFDRHFAHELAALEPLEADGLIESTRRGFVVTPAGRLLVRNVAMCFDAYLGRSASGTAPQYSRTV